MNRLVKDANNVPVPLMIRGGTPQTLTVNASGGAATLSAAFAAGCKFVRLQPTVNTWFLFTVSGAVTSSTGHFMAAGGVYDEPLPAGTTKISVLGVSGAGTCYLSELGY